MTALSSIRQIDYTVIFVRDMAAMRHFYGLILGFQLLRELSPNWIEFKVGANTLALAAHGTRYDDPILPKGALSLQLAFRVETAAVDACAAELTRAGVSITSPPTDQSFGHRTLFFRDPDGNVLEIYSEL